MKDERARSARRLLLHRQDGASAVEFALIAPLLFMIVFAILYFGVAFMKMQNLRSAVREGGRAAAVGAPTIGEVQTRVQERLARIDPERRRRRREPALRRCRKRSVKT